MLLKSFKDPEYSLRFSVYNSLILQINKGIQWGGSSVWCNMYNSYQTSYWGLRSFTQNLLFPSSNFPSPFEEEANGERKVPLDSRINWTKVKISRRILFYFFLYTNIDNIIALKITTRRKKKTLKYIPKLLLG